MSVRILNYKRFRILIPNYGKIGTMPFRFDESHISMGAWENVLEISDGDWMWQKERERERVRKPLSLYTQLIIIWSVFWFYVYRFAIWFPFMFNHFSSCFLSRCFFPDPIASFHGFCFKCDRSTRHYRRKCGRFKCSTRLVGNLFHQEWY